MSSPALNPLVEKVRAAHPGAYDDMDDASLTAAIVAKYPQYSDLALPRPPIPPELQGSVTKIPGLSMQEQGDAAARNMPMMLGGGIQTVGEEAAGAIPMIKRGIQALRSSPAVQTAADVAAPILKATGKTVDAATFDRLGKVYNAWKNVPAEVRAAAAGPEAAAASVPEIPAEVAPAAAAPAPVEAAPAPAPKPATEVYRDATLNKRNIPEYAGEEIPDAKLPEATSSVVDQALPKADRLTNLRTKAQVDFALKRGDIAGAESALDSAAKDTPNWPPARPNVVPATQNIRETDAMTAQAEAGPRRYGSADAQDDRALSQEMTWDLQKHGYRAESEARREFIARNSTGVTKGELVQAAQNPQPEDLTSQWQQALDAINKQKAAR